VSFLRQPRSSGLSAVTSCLPLSRDFSELSLLLFFFKQKTAYDIGLGIPAEPLFRSFDADPKFFACLVRFESSSVPTTLPTAYDVYPLDGRHDGGYYTVKDCVTIDVLPRTPG